MRCHNRRAFWCVFWVLVVASVVIAVGICISKKLKTEKLYGEICNGLSGFPSLKEPYQTAVCYFRDGAYEYLMIQTQDLHISGVRDSENFTVYYLDGQRICLNSEDGAWETSFHADQIKEIIAKGVENYLADSSISYTYKIPRGRDLPLWIYPDNSYYFRITRPGYEDSMEVMTSGERTRGQYIQWNIAKSSEEVLLYLLIRESANIDDLDMVRGWGRLPEGLLENTGDGLREPPKK